MLVVAGWAEIKHEKLDNIFVSSYIYKIMHSVLVCVSVICVCDLPGIIIYILLLKKTSVWIIDLLCSVLKPM